MWLITAMSASRIPACFAALGVLSAQWQSDTLRASLGVWSSSLATKLCLVHLYSRCAKHDRKICRSAFWVSHHKTLHERKMKCVWLFKSNVTGDKTHDKTCGCSSYAASKPERSRLQSLMTSTWKHGSRMKHILSDYGYVFTKLYRMLSVNLNYDLGLDKMLLQQF